MRKIAPHDIETLDLIRSLPSHRPNVGEETIALFPVELEGIETVAICLTTNDGDDTGVFPLAVLVNEDIFVHLNHPDDNLRRPEDR